jgi:hypothetical protein
MHRVTGPGGCREQLSPAADDTRVGRRRRSSGHPRGRLAARA